MISRKCIVTGKIYPTCKLIRFVMLKDKSIVLEKDIKVLGRGAYCLKEDKVIEELFRKKSLNKSFKMNILPETYNTLRKEVDEYVKKEQQE
ncbi:MAG: DUF448 domain-containing protein [Mycoplasma sp.]|nr:DUF448 domain-containing protein [Mycoplasma sp.]